MANEDKERIEWIPPAWTMGGTRDYVIAYSVLPKESVYIILRIRPPREVRSPLKYEDVQYSWQYSWQHSREPIEGQDMSRTHIRKMPPEYYMEFRDVSGQNVKRKHKLIPEEAYFEWQDADYQIASFHEAFANFPELQYLSRENPISNPRLTNDQVAERFANNREGQNQSMTSTGEKLYSYGTVIMQRLPNGQIVENVTSYTNTTHKHQHSARRYIKPDKYVLEVDYYTKDLLPEITKQRVISTTFYRDNQYDLIRIQHNYSGAQPKYYLRTSTNGRPVSWERISPTKAYIEWMEAEYRVPEWKDNIPRSVKNKKRPGYLSNPLLGKRHFHYPFNQWHQKGTELLATSRIIPGSKKKVRLIPGGLTPPLPKIMVINLYRTVKGYYFLEITADIGLDPGYPGMIKYIAESTARLEYRDADEKKVPFREAFPNG